ncbi:EamA family transporter RarD [Ostreibacterium oceani]|nr:EamA family transporter RarD [Ostreibacterium oceani]
MNDQTKGIYAMVLACVIWGSLNVVFASLKPMPAFDIVAHRVIWGMVALLLWLFWKRRLFELWRLMRDVRVMKFVCIAAVLISLNWLGFVYASQTGHALEAGIGYFIFPLVTVAFGAIFKGERLNVAQSIAVTAALLAVGILAYGLGKLPWIAIFLAFTFGLYGLLKSNAGYGATMGVALENIVLAPFAVIWLLFVSTADIGFWSGANYAGALILVGAATAIALLSMSQATKLISLFMVGFLSYLNPLIQSFNATIFLGEDFTRWHVMAFSLIVAGSAFYIWDLYRRAKRQTAQPS